MRFFSRPQRRCLWDEVIAIAIIFVIVWPTVHLWNLSVPVTMTRIDWCSPLECSRTPWILCSHLATFEDADDEVEHKQNLSKEYYQRYDTDETIDALELFERLPSRIIVVTAWHTSDTFVVHRPENQVSTYECDKEVDIAECVVHELTIHLWEPMIYTGKHAKEC